MVEFETHVLNQKDEQIAFFHAAAVTCRRLASTSHDVDLAEVLLELANEYDATGEALALLHFPPGHTGLPKSAVQ